MNNSSKTRLAIAAMMNGFPQAAKDPDLFTATVEQALANADPQAIIEAAQRFTTGQVRGQNTRFAPSIAEFCEEVRSREEHHRVLAEREQRLALPKPTRPFGQGMSPFERRARDIDHEMKGRAILATSVSHAQFRSQCSLKEFPVGACWRANGVVYGPEESADVSHQAA